MVYNSVTGTNLPMYRQVLDHCLVLGVWVEARDGYRLLLHASWSDDASPDALLKLKAITSVKEPLDVKRGMKTCWKLGLTEVTSM